MTNELVGITIFETYNFIGVVLRRTFNGGYSLQNITPPGQTPYVWLAPICEKVLRGHKKITSDKVIT